MPDSIEIIARGALIVGTRVLLCRNVRHGYFYLPGGHVEFGEPAADALQREFAEETGLSVTVGACGLVSENAFQAGGKKHHEINVVFHVEHPDREAAGRPVLSREADIAFEWVELAAVVDTDVRPLSAKAWLASGAGEGGGGPEWVCEMVPQVP